MSGLGVTVLVVMRGRGGGGGVGPLNLKGFDGDCLIYGCLPGLPLTWNRKKGRRAPWGCPKPQTLKLGKRVPLGQQEGH